VNAKQDAQARSHTQGSRGRCAAMRRPCSRLQALFALSLLITALMAGLAFMAEPSATAQEAVQNQTPSDGQPAAGEHRRDENVQRAQQAGRPSPEKGQSDVEHGRYLATQVAMCVMCHSARDRTGRLIEDQLFRGAPIPVRSPYPTQQWAFRAPSIAGLPGGWTEDDLVRLLTKGRRPDGTQPLPPMPPFRMNESDARAVAAFLLSLQ